MREWKKEIFTIPNYLSVFRLLVIPVYISIYLAAKEPMHYYLAGGILTFSCFTDLIDGKIARKFHMTSTLGMLLDPLADKATQIAIIVCLSLRHSVLYPVLLLLVVKESFQLTAAIFAYRNGMMLPGALYIGKICTTIQFVSQIILVLFPRMPVLLINWIALVDIGFLLMSFSCYIFAYYGKNKKIQKWNHLK